MTPPPARHTGFPLIVLATANPHKVDELRAILAGATGCGGTRVVGLGDLIDPRRLSEPEEHGATFEANARIKAVEYATQLAAFSVLPDGAMVLADDSGIEIDALALADGTARPGVISSHYSTDGREAGISRAERDAANNARVLRELENLPDGHRAARFVCCMCLAKLEDGTPRIIHEARGTLNGRIGTRPSVPRGVNGFGYDPLFLVAAEPFRYSKTGAELSSDEKNHLSHRGVAGRAMAEWLARHR